MGERSECGDSSGSGFEVGAVGLLSPPRGFVLGDYVTDDKRLAEVVDCRPNGVLVLEDCSSEERMQLSPDRQRFWRLVKRLDGHCPDRFVEAA